MPRTYQKSGDEAIWESYEKSDKGTKHVFAEKIQDKLGDIRELKDAISFTSKASDLTTFETTLSTWCYLHSGKLEAMGLPEVLNCIRRRARSVQVVVLAYFLMAVGPSVAYSWGERNILKLFRDFPMMDVGILMLQKGCTGAYVADVLKSAGYFEQPKQLAPGK